MNIFVLDFEEVLKNYIPYHDSLHEIRKHKEEFSKTMDSIKSEMDSIVSSSKRIVLDEKTQQANITRYRELQAQAIKTESEFRASIVEKQNTELEKNFQKIIKITEDWSKSNSADLVINKNSAIFSMDGLDITSKIISQLKDMGLYKEFVEEEFLVKEEN